MNRTHAVFMHADNPAGECHRPAIRPLHGAFDMIVGMVIVQSARQKAALRPIAGAPLTLARFDPELAFLVIVSRVFALPRGLGETPSDGLDDQQILPWR